MSNSIIFCKMFRTVALAKSLVGQFMTLSKPVADLENSVRGSANFPYGHFKVGR